MDLKTAFSIPLNQITSDTFSQTTISEIHLEILHRIVTHTLDIDILDRLSPFSKLVPAPAHIRSVHEHIFRSHLSLYREHKREADRQILCGTMGVLFHTREGGALFGGLGGEMHVALSDHWIRPMMIHAVSDCDFPRKALLNLFNSTAYPYQQLLVEQFERIRKALGVSTDVYSECVTSPNPRFKYLLSETA